MVASGVRGETQRFPANGECDRDGKYNPSLPLAFRIAKLFRSQIEAVFEYEE
jgi:DNA-binding XRE family transcriptional regulator